MFEFIGIAQASGSVKYRVEFGTRMTSRLALISLLAWNSPSAFLAGASPLRRTAKVGEAHVYHTIGHWHTSDNHDVRVDYDETLTVLNVSRDGSITIKQERGRARAEADGRPVSAEAPLMSRIFAADNTYIGSVGIETSPLAVVREQNLEDLQLPNFVLKPGKSWVRTVASNPKTGAVKLRAKYTVVDAETVNGIACWRVKASLSEIEGDMPGAVNATYWISKANALEVRKTLTLTNFPGLKKMTTFSGVVDRQLVK